MFVKKFLDLIFVALYNVLEFLFLKKLLCLVGIIFLLCWFWSTFSPKKKSWSFSTNWFTVCSCHVTYAFQSECTLYICLNVKELLARNRRDIWSLSEHIVKCTASLAKWLSVRLRIKWLWVRVPLQSLKLIHVLKQEVWLIC